MKEKHTLIDNVIEQRYEMDVDGDKAVVEYTKQPGVIVLTHTFVPERLEGQGIGKQLVQAVLEDAKSKGLQVVPQCSFIAQYIYRHPEWEEVVQKEVPTH